MSRSFVVLAILLICCCATEAQFEESIFEDEDIFISATPPTVSTGLTAPGTKWCGPGNTATNYDDLGTQRETDICCREHDHCDDIVAPQTTRYGINNTDWFPILKCSCEQKFINCLQNVNTMVANTLGHIYYGARKYCLGNGRPIVRCKQYQEGTFRKRCIRYEVNKRSANIWQLYDMPFYHKTANRERTTENRSFLMDLVDINFYFL